MGLKTLTYKYRILILIVVLFGLCTLIFQNKELKMIKLNYQPGVPYVYEKEVDFRVIVMTHSRYKSLGKLLKSLQTLKLDGARAALEIWIDPDPQGFVHNLTLKTATDFIWSLGSSSVHVHSAHVGILGQWIDTWRPARVPPFKPQVLQKLQLQHARQNKDKKSEKIATTKSEKESGKHPENVPEEEDNFENKTIPTSSPNDIKQLTKILQKAHGHSEIALILEDDMTVSPQAYRWLKAVHRKYSDRKDFAGVTLYSNSVAAHNNKKLLIAPKNQSAYMYVCLGTWGFSPSSLYWPLFQDWYHYKRESQNTSKFWPLVPGTIPSNWFSSFLSAGTQDSMWEMWFIYFSEMMGLFTVYSNLEQVRSNPNSALGVNREEVGLHFSVKGSDKDELILHEWNDSYERMLPDEPLKFGWNGEELSEDE